MWFLSRGREQARRALAAAQAEQQQAVAERDQARALLDQERTRAEQAEADADAARAETEAVRGEAEAARTSAGDAETSATLARTEVDELRALMGESTEASPARQALDRCWPLVLADITRRWAATVGIPPEGRGISAGSTADQLGEALARETERLREEVGVEVSFAQATPVEPANPVVFLLTATDLLGAMASRCERVVVELDGQLLLTGEVFDNLGDELTGSRERAVAAGALVDPIDVGEEQVRIAVRP